ASGGGHHSLVLSHGGSVFSFGCGENGRLGLGSDWTDHSDPQRIELGQDICQVAAGGDCSYALTERGEVLFLGGISLMRARYDHTVALDADGFVWSWGLRGVARHDFAIVGSTSEDRTESEEVVVRAHRVLGVGQLGSTGASRQPIVLPDWQDLEAMPAKAEALGRLRSAREDQVANAMEVDEEGNANCAEGDTLLVEEAARTIALLWAAS
ncbi:MAG: hypothetical protein SGPRY_007577, partial [Prymnesium sp.]